MKAVFFLVAFFASIATAKADFRLSRSQMFFGSVPLHFSRTLYATLTNTGPETISLSSYQPCGAEFWVGGDCRGSLAPGSSCTIRVSYRPMRPGSDFCVLRFRDSTGYMDSISASGRCPNP